MQKGAIQAPVLPDAVPVLVTALLERSTVQLAVRDGAAVALVEALVAAGAVAPGSVQTLSLALMQQGCFAAVSECLGKIFQSKPEPLQTSSHPASEQTIKEALRQCSVEEKCKCVPGTLENGKRAKPDRRRLSYKTSHENREGCVRFKTLKYDDDKPTKVLVLLGPNRVGKTTFLNGLANHLFDVGFFDDTRFECAPAGTTDKVTTYTFPVHKQGHYSYNLCIVDTPPINEDEASAMSSLSETLQAVKSLVGQKVLPGIDLFALTLREPADTDGTYRAVSPGATVIYQHLSELLPAENRLVLASCKQSAPGTEECLQKFFRDSCIECGDANYFSFNLQCLETGYDNISLAHWGECRKVFDGVLGSLSKAGKLDADDFGMEPPCKYSEDQFRQDVLDVAIQLSSEIEKWDQSLTSKHGDGQVVGKGLKLCTQHGDIMGKVSLPSNDKLQQVFHDSLPTTQFDPRYFCTKVSNAEFEQLLQIDEKARSQLKGLVQKYLPLLKGAGEVNRPPWLEALMDEYPELSRVVATGALKWSPKLRLAN